MPSEAGSITSQGLLKKYRVIIFALAVLGIGITLITISSNFYSQTQSCRNFGDKNFFPNTVITATCIVPSGSNQELTFSAFFYSSAGNVAGGETIRLPGHLKITDPTGIVLYDLEFDDRMSISFKPEKTGTYTATITSLMADFHPVWKQTTIIQYSYGFFTHSESFSAMGAFGWLVLVAGIIFVVISVAQAATGRHNSLIVD